MNQIRDIIRRLGKLSVHTTFKIILQKLRYTIQKLTFTTGQLRIDIRKAFDNLAKFHIENNGLWTAPQVNSH